MFDSLSSALSRHIPWLASSSTSSFKQPSFEWSSTHEGKLVGPRMDYKRFVVGTGWALWAMESYVLSRQLRMYSLPAPPPSLVKHIPQETYIKSQAYSQDKARFRLFRLAFDQLLNLSLILGGIYAGAWTVAGTMLDKVVSSTSLAAPGFADRYPIAKSLVYATLLALCSMIPSIPLDFYSHFVIEEKHGFNKLTIGLWLSDLFKGLALSAILGLPVLAAFLKIIDWAGDGFVKYTMAFFFVFVIVFQVVYPTFIQPLFNKLTPLPEGELRTRVEALASKLGFPLKHLYVIDGSKRSGHSNAYFYGLPWSKHIVIYDTLIEQSTPGEIEAVIAHELGHWKYAHPTKLLFVGQFHLFFSLSLFSLFIHNPSMFSSFGFSDDIAYRQQPVMIGFMLFQLVSGVIDPFVSLMINSITRHYEYQADQFALELGKKEELGSALIKLQNENLSSPHNDWLYSMWNHSHPTLVERLKAMDRTETVKEKKEL